MRCNQHAKFQFLKIMQNCFKMLKDRRGRQVHEKNLPSFDDLFFHMKADDPQVMVFLRVQKMDFWRMVRPLFLARHAYDVSLR
jgi:hypothetical protein